MIRRDLPGDLYDSAKYHFDHFSPVLKGGATNVENLRVIPKELKLKKGAKVPSFWDLMK